MASPHKIPALTTAIQTIKSVSLIYQFLHQTIKGPLFQGGMGVAPNGSTCWAVGQ